MPMPITQNMLDDIYGLLKYSNEGIYLIEGEQIGTGTDNEPIIKDVVVLSEMTNMFYKQNNGKKEI